MPTTGPVVNTLAFLRPPMVSMLLPLIPLRIVSLRDHFRLSPGKNNLHLGVDSKHSDELNYESTISDLAGVKMSSKEDGSGAFLERA